MTVPAFNPVAWFEFGTDQPEKVKRGDELGAKVLMDPVTDSAGFTFARLEDTAGNHFGVFSAPAQ